MRMLGERYTGSVEVSGSIPLCSTSVPLESIRQSRYKANACTAGRELGCCAVCSITKYLSTQLRAEVLFLMLYFTHYNDFLILFLYCEGVICLDFLKSDIKQVVLLKPTCSEIFSMDSSVERSIFSAIPIR